MFVIYPIFVTDDTVSGLSSTMDGKVEGGGRLFHFQSRKENYHDVFLN